MLKELVGQVLTETPVGAAVGWSARAARLDRILPDRIRALLRLPHLVSVTLPDGQTVRLQSAGAYDEIASALMWRGFDGYESETTALFYQLSRGADYVYDVGAHSGYFSLLAAAANPRARVHAFEPIGWICDQLRGNIRINGCDGVYCEQMAAEATDGTVELYIPRGPSPFGASSVAGFRSPASAVSVPAITLDTHAAEHEVPRVDLIKMDVEGAEHRVLAGMERLLAVSRPVIISEVLYGRNEVQQQVLLEKHGYRWFWITDQGPVARDNIKGDKGYRFRNYLFVHPARRNLDALLPADLRDRLAL